MPTGTGHGLSSHRFLSMRGERNPEAGSAFMRPAGAFQPAASQTVRGEPIAGGSRRQSPGGTSHAIDHMAAWLRTPWPSTTASLREPRRCEELRASPLLRIRLFSLSSASLLVTFSLLCRLLPSHLLSCASLWRQPQMKGRSPPGCGRRSPPNGALSARLRAGGSAPVRR